MVLGSLCRWYEMMARVVRMKRVGTMNTSTEAVHTHVSWCRA